MKSFQAFRLDNLNQCLWQGDTRLTLTSKPFAVLRYLVDHPGRLVTHDELLKAIWPDTYVQPDLSGELQHAFVLAPMCCSDVKRQR